MPLLSPIRFHRGPVLHLWQMTEDMATLEGLAGSDTNKVSPGIHPKRKRELLSTFALMREIGFAERPAYLPNGKPWIREDSHLSVSHCGSLAGLLLAAIPVGLDIQNENPKMQQIARRFCHPEELDWAGRQDNSMACLTTLWAAKEAVFKIFGDGLHFAEDIRVNIFDPAAEGPLEVRCSRKGVPVELKVEHRLSGDFHLVAAWGADLGGG